MDVALLGVMVPGVENHSLAALGTALDRAGLTHDQIPFGGFADLERMLAAVLRAQPRVCGISLQTTEAMLATLAFTRLLRERGYSGQIVLGGHVASIAAEDILAARAGVDVVVELAGEDALVGLARGESPLELPGTHTRAGRGKRAIPVGPRAIPRPRLAEHLGFGMADLVLSRGCEAHCSYCCIATASSLAEHAGGARHERRATGAIADEIAELVARGGRAFHIMDDNLLPLEPEAALAWARALQAALRTRKVPPIALSLQLRADAVTPAVADALADLGLVRAYVGIDGYSPGQLRALGRAAPATAGNTALALLNERGILCVANALLIGPTIRFSTILDEIDALATLRYAPVHLLPIEARPGTVYHERARSHGLIEGGPLWPVYKFADPRTFLMSEVITNLPTRLAERSVPIALYDLAWALGVAQRLAPAVNVDGPRATYSNVTAAWNADQVRILRLAAAAANDGDTATAELLARERPVVTQHDEGLLALCDRAIADIERGLAKLHGRPVTAHTRGKLLGGLAIAMGLASACSSEHGRTPDAAVPDMFQPDTLAACIDPARTSSPDPSQQIDCKCTDMANAQAIDMTFDAAGVVTGITGATGPLPADLEKCLLDLLQPFCYPTLAGMTKGFTTCHVWIA
jgi:B12 binding protein/radical SAM family protein